MINESDFSFCPKCASKFQPIRGNVLICPSCDLHYYINPKPTNAIILENEKDEILFVVRAHDPKKEMLDLPGGFMDINETVEESLTREIKEELGIDITRFAYVNSFHDEYEHGGISSRSVCVLFRGEISSNTVIKPADDVADFHFYPKNNIPYNEMAFEGMKDAVKRYLQTK